MTREETRIYRYTKHINSTYTSLYQMYRNPSQNKINAEYQCRQLAYENNGYDIKLHYFNCDFFGFSYLYNEVNPETGELKIFLIYKTGRNTYTHEVTDLV